MWRDNQSKLRGLPIEASPAQEGLLSAPPSSVHRLAQQLAFRGAASPSTDQPESAASPDFPSLLSAGPPPPLPPPGLGAAPQILICPGSSSCVDPHAPLSFSVDCAALAFPFPHSCPRLSLSVRPGPLLPHKPIVHTHLWSDAHQTANVPKPECFPRWTQTQPCSQSRDRPAGLHQSGRPHPEGQSGPTDPPAVSKTFLRDLPL